MDRLLTYLSAKFRIKDLGNLHYFLGVEVATTTQGLHLRQTKYINELLHKAGMATSKPLSTPSATTQAAPSSTPFHDPTLYRQLVGGLQYLSMTRPDMAYTTTRLSQYMHAPTDTDWHRLKRALRYLRGTAEHGLYIRSSSSHILQGFSDADWGGDSADRRSTSGYVTFYGPNLISWSSRKQRTVSRSSTEAEYRALATVASEVTWLASVLKEIGRPVSTTPTLWCDNISATYLTANPVFHSRSKHLEIDFHFVRERVADRSLHVAYISSKDQVADALTKPLSTTRFSDLRLKLRVQPPISLREGNKDIQISCN
ncbi:Retrovirus-related Pol polyprotein from transposon RE2 [Linum perenne]